MALDTDDKTSTGPLDIAKSGDDDSGPAVIGGHNHHSGAELLDARPTTEPQNEAELMARKNPLGYTASTPTEEEIEADK